MAQILTRLGVNGQRYEEIINLTEGIQVSQWLAVSLPKQRHLEQSATQVAPLLVPGLLQTTPGRSIGNRRSLLLLHEDDDIDPYRRAVEMVRKVALGPVDSQALIAGYTKRWEKHLIKRDHFDPKAG